MKPGAVNTAFVLDMQRKLYRWSNAAPKKGFADLFNLVCDRRTLGHAWQRLARNKGSQTPGTDGMTWHKIEQRPGGVAQFLEESRAYPTETLGGSVHMWTAPDLQELALAACPDRLRSYVRPTIGSATTGQDGLREQ